MHFSDATCRELTTLVLRGAALDLSSKIPSDLLHKLLALRDGDENFALWWEQVKCSTEQHENWLICHLPSLLNRTFARFGSDPPNPAIQQLWDVVHVVLRLRGLENNLSEQLKREKTEAIYHFAYGLSHELNNPLSNIATRAGVLLQEERSADRRNMLQTIIDHAMRGCSMLGDLMLVARPPQLTFRPVCLQEFCSEFASQAAPWAGQRDVKLVTHCISQVAGDLDTTAMREAIWCLLRNAIEAMPAGGEVILQLIEVAEDQIHLQLLDQGCGLSKLALAHCFDPYFSGREAGRGLGLGLTKAKRIIELHGGELSLTNRPGGGCMARVALQTSRDT